MTLLDAPPRFRFQVQYRPKVRILEPVDVSLGVDLFVLGQTGYHEPADAEYRTEHTHLKS